MTEQERIKGCLLGFAAGERNGGPVQMALRLGQSLADLGRFDPDDIFSRYHDWWKNGAFDTGNVFQHVMALVDAGHTRREAVVLADRKLGGRTAGINPAHRIAPLACALFIPDIELPEFSRREASLTHHHPVAGDVSAVFAVLLRGMIRGESWERAKSRALAVLKELETQKAIQSGNLPFSETGYAPQILANAIWFVETAADFKSSLGHALQYAGPANYSPVLVGALAGSNLGLIDAQSFANDIHGRSLVDNMEKLSKDLQFFP